jgi:hypothetical protein
MNIKKIVLEKMNELFRSDQSKIFLFFAILAIILATIIYKNIIILLIQLVFYYFIIEHINCILYGGCNFKSWILTFIPIIGIVLFILDYLNIFKSLRAKIKYAYDKYDEFEKLMPDGKIDMKINKNEIPI